MKRLRFCDAVEQVLREQQVDSLGQEDGRLLELAARKLQLPQPAEARTQRRILAAVRATPGPLRAREARLTAAHLPRLKIIRFWLAEKAPPRQTSFV